MPTEDPVAEISEEGDAGDVLDVNKEKKSKKEKKKSSKEKGEESPTKKKKKKKKSSSDGIVDDVTENSTGIDENTPNTPIGRKKSIADPPGENIDTINSPITSPESKKKKKKKSTAVDSVVDEQLLTPIPSPSTKKKKKKKLPNGDTTTSEDSLLDAFSPTPRKKLSNHAKYSVEYFEAILEEIKEKCEKKIKIKSKDRDAFAEACSYYYDAWWGKMENEKWLTDLLEKEAPQNEIDEAQQYFVESSAAVPKWKNNSIRKALAIFENLEEDRLTALEDKLVKGAIIAQATPEKLADFAAEGKENEKLLKRLFGDPKLMKDMLRHGGAMKYNYGNAMKIYVDCIGDEDDSDDEKLALTDDEDDTENITKEKGMEKAWAAVNRKIALACALELAAPMYEFDSSVPIDPVARYKHFEKAHRKGELDPAFPYFSVWEMRQIVNCDAPNEQMEWCRKMVMNYVPHVTCLTDNKLRYVYMLQSDVRIRKPEWTGSPRTYRMVLSGGGNESVNSWFARFLLKSFGLPAWGTKHRRKEGYTRWTPEGWEAMNGADWEDCTWNGKTGKDFKTEIEARNKAPPEEYFKKLVSLQCLADVVDGNPSAIPDEEKDVLHPERMWRSLSIVSMELLFQTEPEVPRTFERSGQGLVVTKCEKYLKKYEEDAPDAEISYNDKDGILIIPASRHEFSDGNVLVIDSSTAGKQLNFIADGIVHYELPENIPSKTYSLACEVCTVSSKQTPLTVQIGEDGPKHQIKIPYTIGEWQFSKGIKIDLEPGATLKFLRPKASLGLAVKKFVLR